MSGEMVAAAVWLVVWFLATFTVPGFLAGFGNVAIMAGIDEQWHWLWITGILMWVSAVGFFIFSAVQTVLQVVSIVQLA